MKKYQRLVEQYKKEIEEIRQLKAKANEARDKLNNYENAQTFDTYDYEKAAKMAAKWESITAELHGKMELLTSEIEAEYHDVPFARPRKAGIEKFWELAGI